jgi:uncharacterized protein YecE (DUF72 family)
LPPRARFEAWREQAPADFRFAVKGSRYLTHLKQLHDPAEPLSRLMEAATGLGPKLGPILFQFSRRFRRQLDRLDEFLTALETYPKQRYAFEFRHQSWLEQEIYDRLKAHDAALCLPVGWGIPLDARLTASWTYIRFHGSEPGPDFRPAELREWAERIRGYLANGADVYAYFNNDTEGAAGRDARQLEELLSD